MKKAPPRKLKTVPVGIGSPLFGPFSAAGIAAEHGCLKRHVLSGLYPHANARVRKRIGRSSGRKIASKKCGPADTVVDEIRRSLALEKLAIPRHETGANGQAVIEGALVVPKRIEACHRCSF